MKNKNYVKYLLLIPIILITYTQLKFFYNEFLNLDSEFYWDKYIATVNNLELIEYSGDIKDFPYDVLPLYKCKIEYSFEFKNKIYYGNKISSELVINRDINESIYNKLYNSKKIFIWVNKRNLKQSSLTKKSFISNNLLAFIGFIIFPILIIYIRRIMRASNYVVNKLEIENVR